MAEYINKAELLKAIPTTHIHQRCDKCELLDEVQVKAIIQRIPTTEIVRCSECKHYEANRCWRRLVDCNPTPDWFCGDGETKGESK